MNFMRTSTSKNDQNRTAFQNFVRTNLSKQLPNIVYTTWQLGANPLKSLVPRGGIEPPTRGFSVRCSTD